MKNNNKIYVFIPLMMLLTISCSCGTPGFKSLFSQMNSNNTNEPIESELLESEAVQEEGTPTEVLLDSSQIVYSLDNGDFDVLSVNHFSDDDNETFIVGLIRNNSGKTIKNLDFTITLYDATGKTIAAELVSPMFKVILPGEAVPFNISSFDWEDFDSCDFVVESYDEANDGYFFDRFVDGVDVDYVKIIYDGKFTTILGEVKNNSDENASMTKIAGLVYDNGILQDADYTYADLEIIPPGGKSSFEIFLSKEWDESMDYQLMISAVETDKEIRDLTVMNYDVNEKPSNTVFSGTVKNNSAEDYKYIRIVANLYDADGQLVAAETTSAGNIAANGTGVFELSFWDCPEYSEVIFHAE